MQSISNINSLFDIINIQCDRKTGENPAHSSDIKLIHRQFEENLSVLRPIMSSFFSFTKKEQTLPCQPKGNIILVLLYFFPNLMQVPKLAIPAGDITFLLFTFPSDVSSVYYIVAQTLQLPLTKMGLNPSHKRANIDNMTLNILNVGLWLTEVTRLSSMLMTALLVKLTLEYLPLVSPMRTEKS